MDRDENGIITPGNWRQESPGALSDINRILTNTYTNDSAHIRDILTKYFTTYNITTYPSKIILYKM